MALREARLREETTFTSRYRSSARSGLQNVFTFAGVINCCFIMSRNEEYVENRKRDWLIFAVSLVGTLALLVIAPEWVWVGFPFVFTSLAGALGRL